MIESGEGPDAFVRRGAATAAFTAVRTAAYHGRQAIVLVEAPAGFGKTTVLTSMLHQLRGSRILQARAEPDEATTGYGILGQLLRGWDDALPEPLAAAARGQRVTADPLETGVLLLTVLDRIPQHAGGPGVTLAIDNIQWADSASLRALVFAFRRLRSAPIVLLLTCREDETAGLPPSLTRLIEEEAVRVRLGAFDPAETLELAGRLGLDDFDALAARQVVAHTGGNPLYVRAVLTELAAGGRATSAQPLPIPASYAQLVEFRLAACPPDAAELVRAASLMISAQSLARLAEVAALDPARALIAWDAAIASGLLERPTTAGGPAGAIHPLTQAAVYRTIPAAHRAELHLRAARSLAATDPDAALRHRIHAAVGPDAALAAEAGDRATAYFRDQDWAGATEWFRLALQIADPADADYHRYLLRLVESAVPAMDATVSAEAREALAHERPSPLREYVLARADTLVSDLPSAREHAARAWELTKDDPDGAVAAGATDTGPDLRARIAAELARTSLTLGLLDDAVHWAQVALTLGPEDPTAVADMPGTLLLARALHGELIAALDAFADMPPTIPEPTARNVDAMVTRGLLSLWAGDLQQARTDLASTVTFTRRHGPLPVYVGASAYLSETAYRLGEWDLAITQAESALQLAQDLDHERILPLLHAAAAAPHAARGHYVIAEEHAQTAIRIAEHIGDFQALLWARTAAGRVARSRGDTAAVAAALEPLQRQRRRGFASEPGLAPWQRLYAEALIRRGSYAEAADILDAVGEVARERDLPAVLVAIGGVRALLHASHGDRAAAIAELESADALTERCDQPFELACFGALAGEVSLMAGEPERAAAYLRRALTGFRAFGATPWAHRAATELRRAQVATADRPSPSQLTIQEQRICALLAAGRTNREMASELSVSVKTIEYHMSNILTKLALRSRTEVATWYAAQEATHDSPRSA